MKNQVVLIFDTCTNSRLLCKAIRRTLHLSQRKMSKRLLTTQSYICMFETGLTYRKMSKYEFDRILFNLRVDLEEVIFNTSQTFTSIGKEHAYLILMQVLIEYLYLTSDKEYKKYKDRKEVISLLEKFQDEFKEIAK